MGNYLVFTSDLLLLTVGINHLYFDINGYSHVAHSSSVFDFMKLGSVSNELECQYIYPSGPPVNNS
jgi:hypothetical protein